MFCTELAVLRSVVFPVAFLTFCDEWQFAASLTADSRGCLIAGLPTPPVSACVHDETGPTLKLAYTFHRNCCRAATLSGTLGHCKTLKLLTRLQCCGQPSGFFASSSPALSPVLWIAILGRQLLASQRVRPLCRQLASPSEYHALEHFQESALFRCNMQMNGRINVRADSDELFKRHGSDLLHYSSLVYSRK